MNVPIDPRITSHPMYSESDLRYLRGKGYDDDEIIRFWDRDAAEGRGPCIHAEYEIERLLFLLLDLAIQSVNEEAAEQAGLQGIEGDDMQRVLGIREVRQFDGRDAGLAIEFEDGTMYRMRILRTFNGR